MFYNYFMAVKILQEKKCESPYLKQTQGTCHKSTLKVCVYVEKCRLLDAEHNQEQKLCSQEIMYQH